jgi:uncharacterized SAM-dependent methyltransferase
MLLGHSIGNVTQLYTKLFEDQLRQAVATFDAVLFGALPVNFMGAKFREASEQWRNQQRNQKVTKR